MSSHVLVTGAAGGIGRAVAEVFAAAGDDVTCVDARSDVLAAATKGLTQRYSVGTQALGQAGVEPPATVGDSIASARK